MLSALEAETPEFDDEVIEEATDTVMDTLIEKMIDIDFMVETQVFRLHKREIQAAAAREAIDLKFVWVWEERATL